MNLTEFLNQRKNRTNAVPAFHEKCYRCMRSAHLCYCKWIKAFESDPQFLILIHPIEYARRVASGRMAHLCLKNSFFFKGADFSDHQELNAILKNPANQCVLLYPGAEVTNLSALPAACRRDFVEAGRKLIVIVVDGTWNTAGKMIRSNPELEKLGRICFTPSRPSQWRIRTQPRKHFVSTLEAIHECIELLSEGFSGKPTSSLTNGSTNVTQSTCTPARPHDILLEVFERMIDRHIELGHLAQEKATHTAFSEKNA